MDEGVQVGEVGARFGHHSGHAVEDAPLRGVIGGEDLGGEHPSLGPATLFLLPVQFKYDVGKRSPDVGADPHASHQCCLIWVAQSPPRTCSSDGKSVGGMMSTVAERCWESIPPSTLMTSPVM